ncbi:MAG: methyl-accepting chemotaxis protein [Lysinibacillus sp.]
MNATKEIVSNDTELLSNAYQLSQSIDARLAAARGFILTGDETYKDMFISHSKEAAEFQTALQAYEDYTKIEGVIADTEKWRMTIEGEVFPLYAKGQMEEAVSLLATVDTLANTLQHEYKAFAEKQSEQIRKNGDRMAKDMETTKLVLTSISYLLTFIAIFFALYISSILSKPVNRLMQYTESIARGELDMPPVEVTSNDEIARLTIATNKMAGQLKSTIGQIQESAVSVNDNSHHLKAASYEVTQGMQQSSYAIEQIAEGAEAQATSAGELRTLMQDFTGYVENASKNSMHVQAHSENVQEMAADGSRLMVETEQQMQRIDEIVKLAVDRVQGLNNQTREITQLVKVITDIADQTNLLALNAAIEAARAGEQGKGFAVVADEVRKLAEQVTHSVSNISSIVAAIQSETNGVAHSLLNGYEEVEKGSRQTSISNETMRRISEAVSEMTGNIRSVSGSLQEIANNTGRIEEAIENIAAVSEQTAASSQQTAAAMEEVASSMESVTHNADHLSETADQLQSVVKQFRL